MLTKATLLLGRSATDQEWQFEYHALRSASGQQWMTQNGFLLDFTLGRLVVAAARTQPPFGGSRGFLDHLVHAIQAAAATAARNMWMAERYTRPGREEDHTHDLIARLTIPVLTGSERRIILDRLPKPFSTQP